jgi:CheY-like chemotaxis protein
MKVIVVNDKKGERDAIVLALQKASLSVEGVADAKTAVASIGSDSPSVAVVSWPATGGADLVRLLRGADTSGQMFILAVLDPSPGGRDIPHLVAAGANDFMRRPIVETEIVARTQGPGRLLKWATSVARPAVFDLSAASDLTRTTVWKNMASIVCEDLGAMVGQVCEPASGWPKTFVRDLRGSTITMSIATDQVELRVSVMADRPSLKWLGEALLGDATSGDAALDDVLRELANTAGGAVKRAALPENITLTTGIPTNETMVRFDGAGVQCWTMPLADGKARLAIVGEIRRRENQRVAASSLREGMVLAHDLRTESGALLVAAGSRLTSTAALRLAQVLGPRFFVEVATAA